MKMAALPPISRSFSSEFHMVQEGFKCLTLTPSSVFSRKSVGVFPANDNIARTKTNRRIVLSRDQEDHGKKLGRCDKVTSSSKANSLSTSSRELLCPVWYASEFDSNEKHQKSLEAYLEKLQNQTKEVPSKFDNDNEKLDDQNSQLQTREGLESLERYLSILKEDAKSEESLPSTSGRNTAGITEDSASNQQEGLARRIYRKRNTRMRNSASSPLYDEKESANLYLVGTLLSMNIAVFLFEMASPVKGSDYNLYSLPLIYGAKVNDLIMVGEWWRLVTPMFLHSGLLHITLSSWVLISFGPQVCKGYGSLTFFLIYILGGFSGNFTSFFHTSDPTVGGSGPVFAVIGAWLVYQIQNKDVIEKELAESLFQKAIIATALSLVLGNSGTIDNWTNLGALISGMVYGFFTSPVLQVDDASLNSLYERSRIKEEITLSRKPANPCKSLIIFTLFVSVLASSLLVFAEFSLDTFQIEELVQIVE